ncbi:MAG: GrrA/OscA1 family cyclophane-containing rSAM-modified RiPP [Prochlorococcaceae cyanobacterium]
MAFLSRSRLFGILLIVASLPMDPGLALATQMAEPSSIEQRLRRISAAVSEREGVGLEAATSEAGLMAAVFVNGGGFRNGGFRNGGFFNGGFRNGGFYNGGFRNGGFHNGGWRNGNAAWRNHW